MIDLLEPPAGCLEIPGFILVVEPGKLWLTHDGEITDVWADRGVWPTIEESEAARMAFSR